MDVLSMKFTKVRLLAMLLGMAMFLTSCVPAGKQNESSDYSLGDKLHGFTLVEERDMVSPNALLRLWKHDKTGAQVYFFHNDDQDRTFSIAFRTEPSDDTGKLHILEHAVWGGEGRKKERDR